MTDQEINEAVAKKLGWVYNPQPPGWFLDGLPKNGFKLYSELPDYCHSMEAAWEIVAKKDFMIRTQLNPRDHGWIFECHINTGPHEGIISYAHTAPMAICLAFLKVP